MPIEPQIPAFDDPRRSPSQGENHGTLASARDILVSQANALRVAAGRLDERFTKAVDLILRSPGKVIVTGIGKSGHVAHRLAATMCSTGTCAVYLHASDATHGDLGVYGPGDATILFSKSGSTQELVRLIPILRNLRSPLIAILGNLASPLASAADIVLDARVQQEADGHNVVPSSSSTVAMALGDALAIALMHAREFGQQDFARYHPSGQLGFNLQRSVSEVMHHRDATACVASLEPLRQVVIAMSRYPLGASAVVDSGSTLAGLITDGDLRRALERHEDIRALRAQDVMTRQPISILADASLKEAETLMENRPSQISVLPVVDDHGRYLGLLRLHDLYHHHQQ